MDLLTNNQKKIIEFLAKKDRTLTEITNKLNISKAATLKHLKKLREADLISKKMETTEVGRESTYSLNDFTYLLSLDPDSDTIIQFKTKSKFKLPLLLLEQIEQKEFKEELKELFDRLEDPPLTILYGSIAKGKGTWKSDIDLLFLKEKWSDKEKGSIQDEIAEVNMKIDHQINSEFRTFPQFEKGTTLMEEVKEDGIVIYDQLYEHQEIWQKMKRYRNFSD